MYKYSLIIATLGRKKELLEVIESIKNSDYETSNLEIIIVDQNEKSFLDKELSESLDRSVLLLLSIFILVNNGIPTKEHLNTNFIKFSGVSILNSYKRMLMVFNIAIKAFA